MLPLIGYEEKAFEPFGRTFPANCLGSTKTVPNIETVPSRTFFEINNIAAPPENQANEVYKYQQTWALEEFFPGGGELGDFSKIIPGGAKSGEICFLPLETKKTTFFLLKFSKSRGAKAPPCFPLPTPMSTERKGKVMLNRTWLSGKTGSPMELPSCESQKKETS